MTPEEIVRKRLTSRLSRLRRQAIAVNAEIELTERYLANVEKAAIRPRLKFRKNSQAKWSIQSQIRQVLREAGAPVRAQKILECLRTYDPLLKASTFRSHVKRMADARIIEQEGPRGHYRITDTPSHGGTTNEPISKPRWVKHSIYER